MQCEVITLVLYKNKVFWDVMTKYQKEVYHIGVNVFNKLPTYMKTEFDNPKKFKLVLHKCLYELSLYHLDEYSQILSDSPDC
jgi:hypothetical protein